MYCPGGNETDPIWRVLASSDGISSWNPLIPQHSNPNANHNPLANQHWSIDFPTPLTPLIIPRDSLPSLNLLCLSKTDAWLTQDGQKAAWNIPYVSVAFFPSLKQTFTVYRPSEFSWRPDWIFEIHYLWQSGFSKVYSNCCCGRRFQPEILKIGQSTQNMYIKNIQNFQVSTSIIKAYTKKSGNLLKV